MGHQRNVSSFRALPSHHPTIPDTELLFLLLGLANLLHITAISALGLIGYTRYWSSILAGIILSPHHSIINKTLSISDISKMTMILPDDITSTLKKMNAIEKDADGNFTLSVLKVQQYVRENKVRVSKCIEERDGRFWYQ